MIRALLADDEPLARERLRSLIADESDVELIAECVDGADAVAGIERHEPDLLFLDIQMPEMDGFEVIAALASPPTAVVFVTAFDSYALRAIDVAAVDYLLKPIDEPRFRAAVARARTKIGNGGPSPDRSVAALLERLRSDPRGPQRFVVRSGSRVSFIRADDVEWIEATGNYARVFAGGRAHLVRETMKSIEVRLDPARFVRIHRSVIVHVDRIAVMEPYFHGEWVVKMRDGTQFTSSRTHSERIRALIR